MDVVQDFIMQGPKYNELHMIACCITSHKMTHQHAILYLK